MTPMTTGEYRSAQVQRMSEDELLADYDVLGNKREQVRQLGNAVTPPAARDLLAALAESLGQEVAT